MTNYATLKEAFEEELFFKDKTWRYSPISFPLSQQVVEDIKHLGSACFDFLRAINTLYYASKNNKSILRNEQFLAPWIADYYDRGKPQYLIDHSNFKNVHRAIPTIIRPDLILTENGLALTELEVIPGGIGLTSFLYQLYREEENLIGSTQVIKDGFYNTLVALNPTKTPPSIGLVVSNESETYRPEFQWLAKQFQREGKSVFCLHPNQLSYENGHFFVHPDQNKSGQIPINVIYRFFELFDLDNILHAMSMLEAEKNGHLAICPPIKPHFEEKLSLALFHHYQLEDYWKESLPKKSYTLLKRTIPKGWIIDADPFGPNAILNGPQIEEKPLKSWYDLSKATKKNRDFIIKISGFNGTAWGARGLTLGTDSSQEIWTSAIEQAIESYKKNPYIIQEYVKPRKWNHPMYKDTSQILQESGRARLCPYYMKDMEEESLKGILATFCPANKKIIHGMSVATFLPCKRTN